MNKTMVERKEMLEVNARMENLIDKKEAVINEIIEHIKAVPNNRTVEFGLYLNSEAWTVAQLDKMDMDMFFVEEDLIFTFSSTDSINKEYWSSKIEEYIVNSDCDESKINEMEYVFVDDKYNNEVIVRLDEIKKSIMLGDFIFFNATKEEVEKYFNEGNDLEDIFINATSVSSEDINDSEDIEKLLEKYEYVYDKEYYPMPVLSKEAVSGCEVIEYIDMNEYRNEDIEPALLHCGRGELLELIKETKSRDGKHMMFKNEKNEYVLAYKENGCLIGSKLMKNLSKERACELFESRVNRD